MSKRRSRVQVLSKGSSPLALIAALTWLRKIIIQYQSNKQYMCETTGVNRGSIPLVLFGVKAPKILTTI